MKDTSPKIIKLEDYRPSAFFISDVYLTFHLHETETVVKSRLNIYRNPDFGEELEDLILSGEGLKFISAKLNGAVLSPEDYTISEESLIIPVKEDSFILEIENIINPSANTSLQGLYRSQGMFCTQNEPEGFRSITYFLDRPDVMAKYKTKIIADKVKYPILLSNGNPILSGDLENGMHFVEWEDPFVKPSYLYALVAGDLGLVQDAYTTGSNRKIDLRIYCEKGNEDKCHHAMASLKKAMKWDEDVFGLEYDLDIYMIVAVDAFNMGAMENKGLNIFNSSAVLASPEIATDMNYHRIESIVAHEYFHNWTGNRVTCRDWFQLTLKEGLTVFRDQEFSADMNSRAVQRIQDVQMLKDRQFVEDDGPTAHSIRPERYMEINNFYTATVYEKGAEVIRMIHTLLGNDGFRKGMDKYFELYDGQAVTCEDFVSSMEVANGIDLSQFKNWYSQWGTPRLEVEEIYNDEKNTLELKFRQSSPSGSGPLYFPFKLGLLNKDGADIKLELKEGDRSQLDKGILHVKNREEHFVFNNVPHRPILSLNRDFSAPVKLEWKQSYEDMAYLMAHDSNAFNRYEASQGLALKIILNLTQNLVNGEELELDEIYVAAFEKLLIDEKMDLSHKALCLSLPSMNVILQDQNPMEFEASFKAREFVKKTLAEKLHEKFLALYNNYSVSKEYLLNIKDVGERTIKNTLLNYLMCQGNKEVEEICYTQFNNATNMTDEMASLFSLSHHENDKREQALDSFFKKWKNEQLVMEKWLSVQGSSPLEDTFERVLRLESSPIFDKNIPNLTRSLWGSFANNVVHFHHKSGRGYHLIADKILTMDSINPQVSSQLAKAFRHYKKLNKGNSELMKIQLERILATPKISKNLLEIIGKTLGQ
ncbi:MAG: aminopeptidase N [Epsilonproteobacteria bacterium]|nr:MAG: aminopeptidase N [Campylobacterota bacterium]RLA67328.1 MAG: aminopeptidase N [Campylobacterota bacterium]